VIGPAAEKLAHVAEELEARAAAAEKRGKGFLGRRFRKSAHGWRKNCAAANAALHFLSSGETGMAVYHLRLMAIDFKHSAGGADEKRSETFWSYAERTLEIMAEVKNLRPRPPAIS
jgi:hypothetical protein